MAASQLDPTEAAKGVAQKLEAITSVSSLTVTGEGTVTIRIVATVAGTSSDQAIQSIIDSYTGDGFTVIFERNRRAR